MSASGSISINLEPAIKYLTDEVGISRAAAEQIVEYLAGAKVGAGCDAVAGQSRSRTFL